MEKLEIIQQLREQIKEQWFYVATILALYDNNYDKKYIKDEIDRLLPKEVFYQDVSFNNIDLTPVLLEKYGANILPIQSIPIYQVLFATKENPLGNI
jgi:hypothetical protein